MDKLLPCPFCNTNAPMFELDREQGCKWGQVVCGCCGCKGPEVRTDYTEDGPWIADAIREWNTRHTPEGWQLVPTHRPTVDMTEAGACHVMRGQDYERAQACWNAMLAASPKWGGE